MPEDLKAFDVIFVVLGSPACQSFHIRVPGYSIARMPAS